jgi:hypothetical protein
LEVKSVYRGMQIWGEVKRLRAECRLLLKMQNTSLLVDGWRGTGAVPLRYLGDLCCALRQCRTVLCRTALDCTVPYCTGLYCAVLHWTVPCRTVLCSACVPVEAVQAHVKCRYRYRCLYTATLSTAGASHPHHHLRYSIRSTRLLLPLPPLLPLLPLRLLPLPLLQWQSQ